MDISRLRPHALALLGAILGAAVTAWVGLVGIGWNDYAWEAEPAFNALAHGHVSLFLSQAPAYGGSFILRAPFAAAAGIAGGGELTIYRMVAVPGLIAAVWLAVWVNARARTLGVPALARGTFIALVVAGPVTWNALEIGHSEEVLVAVLVVGAMLAGLSRRTLLAGLLLGVAVAAKPWALVAVVPVLLAVGPRWWRTALVSVLACAAVLAPLALGATEQFTATTRGMAQTGTIFQPDQVFWYFGEHAVVRGGDGQVKAGFRAAPEWVVGLTHPLVVIVGLLVPLLWLVRRRRRDPVDLLLVLSLVLHLRCLLDAWNIGYYALPAVFALATWEVLARRRPPAAALSVSLLLWITFHRLDQAGAGPDAQTAFYLAWAVPLTVWMGALSFGASYKRPTSHSAALRFMAAGPITPSESKLLAGTARSRSGSQPNQPHLQGGGPFRALPPS